ncbi:MAG: hypothetical protein GY926_00590 [bacterium]|nr:hypothetical protein [bacterium]
MVEEDVPTPGRWPMLSRGSHARLVQLARRRLGGHTSAAEDIVQQAFIKWTSIDESRADRARLEQVVKTEAASYLRSEGRRKAREIRYATDRARGYQHSDDESAAVDLRLAAGLLASLARQRDISITTIDVRILTQLLNGETISGIARDLDVTRRVVKQSRQRWQLVARLGGIDGSTASTHRTEVAGTESVPECGDLG